MLERIKTSKNINNKNHEFLGNPFYIKYYKNNEEDKANKRSTIHLKEDKYFLNTINQKIENTLNRKSKDKVKKVLSHKFRCFQR